MFFKSVEFLMNITLTWRAEILLLKKIFLSNGVDRFRLYQTNFFNSEAMYSQKNAINVSFWNIVAFVTI